MAAIVRATSAPPSSDSVTATESGPDFGRTMLQTLQANLDVDVSGWPRQTSLRRRAGSAN